MILPQQLTLVAAMSAALMVMSGCTAPADRSATPTPDQAGSSASAAPTPTAAPTSPVTSAPPATGPAPSPGLPSDLNAALRDAAGRNDAVAAEQLIDAGADVNAKSDKQESAYLLAASEGAPEVLELTLAHGANVNDKDRFNGTALIRAAERGHFHIVGLLLRAGIDKDHVNRLGWQAIHEAAWLGTGDARYEATVRVLVAGGVQLDRPDRDNRLTPLAMARRKGQQTVAATLGRAGREYADPTPGLLQDAESGDADAVAYALRNRATLEARDSRERTALLLASAADRVAAARVLVAMGADPDALDDRHDTPWLVTGVTGSVDMLEVLVPAHPDLTIRNRFGGTALIPASERGHVDYVRRVVRTGIDVNHVNDLGLTALLEAVILGDGGPRYQEIVRTLVAAGADRTIPDRDGVTALQHARRKNHTELVGILSG